MENDRWDGEKGAKRSRREMRNMNSDKDLNQNRLEFGRRTNPKSGGAGRSTPVATAL
jgi:hypothetical protein